ncbi:MAG: hypothetical protein WCW77_05945 [Patescibacteria group bacterium]|jgi:hypothetical protein
MPRRKKEGEKKAAKSKREPGKPKKSFIKVNLINVKKKAERENEERLVNLREKEAENFQNETENYEKVERSKRLVMWSGVSFFMLVIVVVWFFNIRSVFQVSSSSQSNFDWNAISNDVSKSMEEAKKGFEEIKKASEMASTSPSSLENSAPTASSTPATLPKEETSAVATSSPDEAGQADLKELKKRIDELEQKLK